MGNDESLILRLDSETLDLVSKDDVAKIIKDEEMRRVEAKKQAEVIRIEEERRVEEAAAVTRQAEEKRIADQEVVQEKVKKENREKAARDAQVAQEAKAKTVEENARKDAYGRRVGAEPTKIINVTVVNYSDSRREFGRQVLSDSRC